MQQGRRAAGRQEQSVEELDKDLHAVLERWLARRRVTSGAAHRRQIQPSSRGRENVAATDDGLDLLRERVPRSARPVKFPCSSTRSSIRIQVSSFRPSATVEDALEDGPARLAVLEAVRDSFGQAQAAAGACPDDRLCLGAPLRSGRAGTGAVPGRPIP
jgi:hypothetical protein